MLFYWGEYRKVPVKNQVNSKFGSYIKGYFWGKNIKNDEILKKIYQQIFNNFAIIKLRNF